MKKASPAGSGRKYPEKRSGKAESGSPHSGKPKRRFDGEERFKKTYGSASGRADKAPGDRKDDTSRPARRDHGGDKFADRKATGKDKYPAKDRSNSDRRDSFEPGMRKTASPFSGKRPETRDGAPARGRFNNDRYQRNDRGGDDASRPARRDHGGDKFADRKAAGKNKSDAEGRPQRNSRDSFEPGRRKTTPPFSGRRSKKEDSTPDRKRFNSDRFQRNFERPERNSRVREEEEYENADPRPEAGPMPLNKYIAHSGESSRRDAAALVKQGKVRVNGELILDPGHKVEPGDKVTLAGKKLTSRKNLVYVLLNKPKGFLTTTDDPKGRKTVMSLVAQAADARLFPVGRLDRNTTGLLLMTNDGDLAQKLSHPSYQVKKVYQVTLDKPLTKADFDQVLAGVKLEDGVAPVDSLAYLEDKHDVGIEIHSGRNRIVRRIFESLGYEVVKLDRVMYAGLTKKNIPRGKWRFLNEREVILLRHFKN